MKSFLALILLSNSLGFAQTYDCRAQGNRLTFKPQELYSTLLIQDRRMGEIVMDAVVDEIRPRSGRSSFVFGGVALTFKDQDLADKFDLLVGNIDGNFGRGKINQSLRCSKVKP